MPQSSKAPPDPVTITPSEIMQAEVARIKKLLGLDINRLAIGLDIEGVITGGIFGAVDYTTTGISTISLVNVSTSVVMGIQTNAVLIPGLMLQLHLNSSFYDTSSNNHSIFGNNGNGFVSPGAFGTAWKCNSPTVSNPIDYFYANDHASLRLDPSIGFSVSVWIYPTSLMAGNRKSFVSKRDDATNEWYLQIEPTTLLVQFGVKKAGVDYKRQTASGLTLNAWNHVAATFNSSTNAIQVYKNAVAGVASTAATQYEGGPVTIWTVGTAAWTIDPFLGYIDEIHFWQGMVLTSTQVTNMMNTNAP